MAAISIDCASLETLHRECPDVENAAAVNAARKKVLQSIDQLPPFSPVLRRLLATVSLDDDEISLPKLADLVQHDTVIAGKVLAIANSALYNRGHEICSISNAVFRLGTHRLRNAVLGLSVDRIWNKLRVPDGFSMLRFNEHALATATASELLAERLGMDGGHAFIAGLFHDIGQLLIVHAFPFEYGPYLAGLAGGEELALVERESFGSTHGDFSAETMARWNLPADIQSAVRFHENPMQDDSAPCARGLRLSDIVHAADRFACASGFCVSANSPDETPAEDALISLGMNASIIQDAFTRAFSVFRA